MKTIEYLIILFVTLTSSVFAKSIDTYYPLNVGNYWVYEEYHKGEKAVTTKTKEEIEGTEVKNEQKLFRVKSTRISQNETFISYYWYKKDANGNITNCSLGASPELILIDWEPPIIIISYDAMVKGASWENTFISESDIPDSTRLVKWQHVVESISETVTVPAGTFSNCIKVRMTNIKGHVDAQSIHYHYFAKGVGVILCFSEGSEGTTYRRELIEYSVKNN